MPRKRVSRIYWRTQGAERRAYADLRDAGGGREALIPEGELRATTDPVIAEYLLGQRLAQLQEQKRDRALLKVKRRTTLEVYVAEHLVKKAEAGKVTAEWLAKLQKSLEEAVRHFGPTRDLAAIDVDAVQGYARHLAQLPNGRGGRLSAGSQRHYLNALSNLFRRAQAEGVVRGVNSVAALMDKPVPRRDEARWLEVWEGALLLEAARTYPYELPDGASAGARLEDALRATISARDDAVDLFAARMRAAGTLTSAERVRAYISGERIPTRRYLATAAAVLGVPEERLCRPRGWVATRRPDPLLYPLLGTFLLSGGRESEVYGLELGDVNLLRKTITFRPTRRRRLKSQTSRRVVPLWPQLAELLAPHLEARRARGARENDLVFPSPRTGAMLTDVRKALDAIAERVGWGAGEIRTKVFRHTYCAARLQSLDRGAPVSEYTVAREMGHGGFALVRRVYGHLGDVRHRSELVEYRLDQQRDAIPPERLRLLLRAV